MKRQNRQSSPHRIAARQHRVLLDGPPVIRQRTRERVAIVARMVVSLVGFAGGMGYSRPMKCETCDDTFTEYRGSSRLLRSEEHTSELQSLMRISYAVFCLKKKIKPIYTSN